MVQRRPRVYRDATHQPLDINDELDSDAIPISGEAGNDIRVINGQLYVGFSPGQTAYYVAAAGVDDPTRGTKAQPFKTLDFALLHLQNLFQGEFRGNAIIAL